MSLFDQIFAALSGAPTQNARLLVLHTTLGTDVLLAERVEIDEHVGPVPAEAGDVEGGGVGGSGYRMVVHALATDTHIELKNLIGKPALLELLTQPSRTDLRPFHGHITEAALLGSDGGMARYRLVIEPWLSFLSHGRDSYVFQAKTVVQIIEEVFNGYASQGRLAPLWRWELADASVYAERSLCIQYQESDLEFVMRLMREEGLFYWFEHDGDADDDSLGQHTLVIADHNEAFEPNDQPRVRFTQAGATMPEDSITRWHERSALHTATVDLASHDYRSLAMRPQSQTALDDAGNAAVPSLGLSDVPAIYAYEDAAQGERLALRQMQALDALRAQAQARGTLRTAAPGTTFTLTDQFIHDGSDDERDRFVMLGVQHRARNNLQADDRALLDTLLGAIAKVNLRSAVGHTEHHVLGQASDRSTGAVLANNSEEPLYQSDIKVQRAAVAVRMAGIDEHGLPDPRLHARPTVNGAQTAVVVGLNGAPIHADRDHRVKVQFHWQRGAGASHRIGHGSGDENAPADDTAGTWVRVSAGVAGANWGSVFTPRLGQEVLVQFVAGDIDRPVVIGSLYNGEGTADGQGNQVAGAAANATGNAVAWFPGTRKEQSLEGHQHTAVLAGYKSQEMSTSQAGSGGYNQLVFDDSAQGNRIELGSSAAQSRLQLGHLVNQNDNQRLQLRGHGVDMSTAGWGAVRAGSGVLLSAHGKSGSVGGSMSLDSQEPRTQIEQSQELLHTLAESAQQHKAKGDDEPDVAGAKKDDTAKQLPNEVGLYAAVDSLLASDERADVDNVEPSAIGGGAGQVTAWGRPDMVVAAPAGIASFTPAAVVASAGNTASLVAGTDMHFAAQANHAWAVKSGFVFYTYGKATDTTRPNQEVGIKFHAATGSLNAQSQTGATHLTADKAISVASTDGMVRVTAAQSILLTAGGGAIDIQPGSITLKGSGNIEFKAAAKELTSAGSASQSLDLKKPGQLFDEQFCVKDKETGEPLRYFNYRVETADGKVLASGITGTDGKTSRVHTAGAIGIQILAND